MSLSTLWEGYRTESCGCPLLADCRAFIATHAGTVIVCVRRLGPLCSPRSYEKRSRVCTASKSKQSATSCRIQSNHENIATGVRMPNTSTTGRQGTMEQSILRSLDQERGHVFEISPISDLALIRLCGLFFCVLFEPRDFEPISQDGREQKALDVIRRQTAVHCEACVIGRRPRSQYHHLQQRDRERVFFILEV
jgi:hypothetical protein